MLSNTSPLNWQSTLRRLRKDAQMGQLGKDIGILPGRKTFNAQLNGLTTKHRPTHVISAAAEPAENKQVHTISHSPWKVPRIYVFDTSIIIGIGICAFPERTTGCVHGLQCFSDLPNVSI